MRFNEFEKLAKTRVEERRGMPEGRIDEVLPVIGAALGAGAKAVGTAIGVGARAAGAVAGMAGRAVAGAARAGAQMGAAAAKKVGAAAAQGAQSVGQGLAQKVAQKNAQALQKAVLKKGTKLPMPTKGGRLQDFEVDNLQGDEVTLKNPKPQPGEPVKTVHKTKDLDPIIQQMVK